MEDDPKKIHEAVRAYYTAAIEELRIFKESGALNFRDDAVVWLKHWTNESAWTSTEKMQLTKHAHAYTGKEAAHITGVDYRLCVLCGHKQTPVSDWLVHQSGRLYRKLRTPVDTTLYVGGYGVWFSIFARSWTDIGLRVFWGPHVCARTWDIGIQVLWWEVSVRVPETVLLKLQRRDK